MRGILFEAYLKRILGGCLSENRRNDVSEFRISISPNILFRFPQARVRMIVGEVFIRKLVKN